MDEFRLDLRALLGLLRRQSRAIILTVIVVLGLCAVAILSLTPIYTASALVLVDTAQKNLLSPDFSPADASSESARVESEMEILQSDTLLLKVVEKLNLVSDPEFGARLGFSDRILAFLQIAKPTLPTGERALQAVLGNIDKALTAERRGETNVIALEARSEDPAKAATIANAWAAAYIEDQVSAKIDSSLASRDILQGRLTAARDAIVKSEGALDAFINDNLGNIIDDTGRTDIASLRKSLDEVTAQLGQTTRVADLAQSSLAQRNWASLAQTLQSNAVAELERQRTALETTLAAAPEERTVALRGELAQIEQRLVDAAAGELTTLRQTVRSSETREAELRQQLRSTVLSSAMSPKLLAEIYELQQGAELARVQHETLLGRIQSFDAQASVQVADSRVVSPAMPPSDKSFPNTSLMLSIAGLVALALGLILAFLRENILGGLLTEEQSEAVLKVPVAAAVPRQRGSDAGGEEGLAAMMQAAPLSPFAEAIRRIRAAIDQVSHRHRQSRNRSAPRTPAPVIMVTSSTANEGKSTIALSLARAYGLSRRSVLLIDCDLRKPSINRMIDADPAPLIELLDSEEESIDLPALVRPDKGTGIHVIGAGRPSDVPTDQLVAGDVFARLLETARSIYDVVILDTPPVGPVVDGLYLAADASVILFIVRAGTTSQAEARLALASLLNAKGDDTRVLSVLNQQERASASYKGRYETYYYGGAT